MSYFVKKNFSVLMNKNIKYILYGVGILFVCYALYVCFNINKPKEDFSVDGSINGAVPAGGLVYNAPQMIEPTMDTFADIVSPSEPLSQPSCGSCTNLPLAQKAGLHTDYRDLLPDVNTNATSYDIDVADPEVFLFRPSIRTAIHNRQQEGADPYRGDLPIEKGSCGISNNGWFTSRYGVGDTKLDGFFSEFSNAKFRSLTGQKSYPSFISNEGLIGDFQPVQNKGNELVLQWY